MNWFFPILDVYWYQNNNFMKGEIVFVEISPYKKCL